MNTSPIPEKIIKDIEAEREYAAQYWNEDFDRNNSINDWAAYINQYLARATKMRPADFSESMEQQRDRQRIALVKVAGLAISALEAFDRNEEFYPRHYDY